MSEREWQSIETAPMNATEVLLKRDDREFVGHWACDLSGGDQPPFKGWFEAVIDDNGKRLYFRGIEPPPTHWKPVPPPTGSGSDNGDR